jgi:predicted nucleotidyltransferase
MLRMNPVQTKDDIAVRLAPCQEKIRQLGVISISVFGSFVRNEANSDSDVDLLVQFAPGTKTFDNFMALAFLLEDALGRTVELVTTESLSPYIGKYILDEAENVPFAA